MKNMILIITVFLCLLLAACAEEFLDMKRDKKQVIPKTIADQQALLDNTSVVNMANSQMLNAIGGEEYSVTRDAWQLTTSAMQRNAYIWAKDVFEGAASDDWDRAYSRILYANSALDGIHQIKPTIGEQSTWNNVKGSALFIRAFAFYQLAQTFCKPYDATAAGEDLGIPLRLEADITVPVSRATVQQTYEQLLSDLGTAADLLPLKPQNQFRPGKAAAFALLAKTHMHMGKYSDALEAAGNCIALSNGLLDFNTLNPALRYPFASMLYGANNPEVLYFEAIPGITLMNASRYIVDPDLYALYEDGDIRKTAFFFPTRGTYTFKGSYVGAYNFFGGLALDEVLLIRAECYTRMGQPDQALEDLNEMRKKRYHANAYTALTTTGQSELMDYIIKERRKELLCRGIRWEDLRRFNREAAFAKTLNREIGGVLHTLAPQNKRYVWPIPDQVIAASGMVQNER